MSQSSTYAHMAAHYDRLFPITIETMVFLQSYFKPTTTLLDIGCGSARWAHALACTGVVVTAVDPDLAMLDVARAQPTSQLIALTIQPGTLMHPGVDGPFDGIMIIGNTLPHLSDANELRACLSGVAKRLTAQGTVVLQLLNYDKIFAEHITRLPDLVEADIMLERHYRLTPPYVQFTTVLCEGAQRHLSTVTLFGITQNMLHQAVEEAGLIVEHEYGDFKKKPYDITHDLRWVLVIRKRVESEKNHA